MARGTTFSAPADKGGVWPGVLRPEGLTRRSAGLLSYDSTTSAVSSTEGVATGIFARVVVITTTLIRISRVPRIVRTPRPSPPRKYPTRTATTGFTYA